MYKKWIISAVIKQHYYLSIIPNTLKSFNTEYNVKKSEVSNILSISLKKEVSFSAISLNWVNSSFEESYNTSYILSYLYT